MSLSQLFNGFVLRKPVGASSNSPFACEGDTLVLDRDSTASGLSDKDIYTNEVLGNTTLEDDVEYLVFAANTSNMVVPVGTQSEQAVPVLGSSLSFSFNEKGMAVKNVSANPTPARIDKIACIIEYDEQPSFTPQVQYEYEPLKLYFTKNDNIKRFDFDPFTQRWLPLRGSKPTTLGVIGSEDIIASEIDVDLGLDIRIGELDSTPLTPEWVYGETSWPVQPSSPNHVSVLVDSGELLFDPSIPEGTSVYQFSKQYKDHKDSTGLVGYSGERIFLSPIPDVDERPLIRLEHNSYLNISALSDPKGDDDVRFDSVSGELHLVNTFEEGLPVYYDGVLSSYDAIPSYVHKDLGTITQGFINPPPFTSVDANEYPEDSIILYVKETGIAIREIEWITDGSQAKRPYELPDWKVQGWNDNGSITFNVSSSFASKNVGYTLRVGNGDFYLEKGITFRLKQSVVDPTNEKGLFDGHYILNVKDSVVTDNIRSGLSVSLPQIPLQDIAGYGQNIFYRRQEGLRQHILIPDQDIVYDFDNTRFLWSERVLNNEIKISRKQNFVKLNHEALHDVDVSLEIDEGSGFTTIPPNEYQIDLGSGYVSLLDPKGRIITEGSGSIQGGELYDEEANFNFNIEGNDSVDPFVLFPTLNVASQIEAVDNPNSLLLNLDITLGDNIPYQVIEGTEKVFDNKMEPITLNKTWVQVFNIQDVGSHVPSAKSYSFLIQGSPFNHVELDIVELGLLNENDTLTLPSYYVENGRNFKIFREFLELTEYVGSGSVPTNHYKIDGNVLEFNEGDKENFLGDIITLVPSLSDIGSRQVIEVLSETKEIGLPQGLSDVEIRLELDDSQFTVQDQTGLIFFNNTLPEGSRCEVSYFTDEDTSVEKELGFLRKEIINPLSADAGGMVHFAQSLDLIEGSVRSLYINGAKQDITISNKSVPAKFLNKSRQNEIHYYSTRAVGNERYVSIGEKPYYPPVQVVEGFEQSFWGDHTSDVREGCIIQVGESLHYITSAEYDTDKDKTLVSLNPAITTETLNPETQVSSKVVTDIITVNNTFTNKVSKGQSTIQVFTSSNVLDDVLRNQVLFLDGAPHFIENISSVNVGVWEVSVRTPFQKQYNNPLITLSKDVVWEGTPQILRTRKESADEDVALIRFKDDRSGHVLERDVQYRFLQDGSIILDSVNTDLPSKDESWFLIYNATKYVEPKEKNGRLLTPKVRASYTRFVNATTENRIEGSSLLASYSFYNPDSYYFKVSPLLKFSESVAEDLGSGGGALTTFSQNMSNEDKGTKTLTWEESDWSDKDRIGRRFIQYYNRLASRLERYLQILDGRVVGDRSGQFKFTLQGDGLRGGDDPYTGRLISYYVNKELGDGTKPDSDTIKVTDIKEQSNYILNSIDDYVMTSPKPYTFSLGSLGFRYNGTFRQAWEPHILSRFFPQEKEVALVTPPSFSREDEYQFLADFLKPLGDLQQDDVLSIKSLTSRSARAWLMDAPLQREGNKIKIRAGISYLQGQKQPSNQGNGDPELPSLTQGDPANLIPPFEEGDIVNIGRVTFEKTPEGFSNRVVHIYAQNIKIADIDNDVITLEAYDLSDPEIFDDENNLIETITDPLSLLGLPPRTGYDATLDGLLPQGFDTIFTKPKDFYRQTIDYGLDSSEGELVNHKLPNIISKLTGQNAPKPITHLDAVISFKNKRVEPYRFPALDGASKDDFNLFGVPYSFPTLDSEITSFAENEKDFKNLLKNSVEGIVLEGSIEGNRITFPIDLDDINPTPSENDLALIDGQDLDPESWSGGLTPYYVSDVQGQTVYLKSFNTKEQGVDFHIENAITGSGNRDSNDLYRWEVINKDFTSLGNVSGVLNIVGGNSYNITEWGNGYVETESIITETSGNFTIEIEDEGHINNLHSITTSLDYSLIEDGATLTITYSNHNNGSYIVYGGGINTIHVYPLKSNAWQPFVASCGISPTAFVMAGDNGSIGDEPNEWIDAIIPDFQVYYITAYPRLHILTENILGEIEAVHTYKIKEFHADRLVVDRDIEVLSTSTYYITSTSNVTIADGAIPNPLERKLYVRDSSLIENVKVGHVLKIQDDSYNDNYYRVVDVVLEESPYPYVEVDRDFKVVEGDITNINSSLHSFPLRFTTYNARRFSAEIDDALSSLLRRRVIYEEVEDAPTDIKDLLVGAGVQSRNPATPSVEVLNLLVSENFGSPVTASTEGEIYYDTVHGGFILKDDNIGTEVEQGFYLTIKDGLNEGFYKVGSIINDDEIEIVHPTHFGTDIVDFLDDESDVPYEIYRPSPILTERTQEVIFFEYVNIHIVLNIIDTFIRWFEPTFSTFEDRSGDPSNEDIASYLYASPKGLPVGLSSRYEWISESPSVVDEILGILRGSESVYDIRYSWIDFRLNQESGTLPNIKRFAETKDKRRKDNIKKLIRQASKAKLL